MYEKFYDIRLDADDIFVIVIECKNVELDILTRKDSLSDFVLMRSFVELSVENKFHKFQQIQHVSIVSSLKVFRLDRTCYVVFKYMIYSLYYVVDNSRFDEI